ncbi:RNA pseudouridine synthase [Bacteroidia bacterium]|nr:RNA pseudouridine synthase [Bacteroidia bacterium]
MNILYEDNHLIALNKRPGEIVQGDKTGDECLLDTLKHYIKERDSKQGEVYIGLPHRIDRPTSGAVVFAKTSKALSRINRLIQDHEFHKTYWAIVKNKPPKEDDHLIHWLKKNEKQNKSYVVNAETVGAVRAELIYKIKSVSDHYFLLEIQLLTGRHHQIRAQLSAIGSPIAGDMKYGFPRPLPDASITLHARKVEFVHPVQQQSLSIVAPVPNTHLWKIW